MKIKRNMGSTDRLIRSMMAIALSIYAFMTLNPIFAIPISLIAFTVSTRWCVLYQIMGINTGCHLDNNATKGTRNNLKEGLALSAALLLILGIAYLIIRYINIG